MSDHGHQDEPPRRRYSGDQSPSPYDALGPPPDDDPMAALEQRLQSMGPATAAPQPQPAVQSAPLAPAPSLPRERSRGRPRPAGTRRRRGSLAARIAAPVVFLVAVIALVALVYESGIVGGAGESPSASPTPAATKGTKSGGQSTTVAVKKYTVKEGDTLSGIAVKYDTTVNTLLDLNPDLSTSTLVVGARIKVPKPSPSP